MSASSTTTSNNQSQPPPQANNDEYLIIDKYSVLETLLFYLMFICAWIYGYLTLIPYYLKYRTFRNILLDDIPSVCVEDEGEHGKTFRNQLSVDAALCSGYCGVNTLGDIMPYAAAKYGDRQFLGKRKVVDKQPYTDEVTGRNFKKYSLGEYEWKSFNQINTLVDHFKNGLLHVDIWDNKKVPKIAIFAQNSEEWIVSKLGIFATYSILVTVFSNMDDASIIHAIDQTEPDILIVDKHTLKRILSFIDSISCVRKLIVIGKKVEHISSVLTEKSVDVWSYDEIVELGKRNLPHVVSTTPPTQETLAVIMFTSGSSGRPKGVCLSHLNILSSIGSLPRDEFTRYHETTPFYLPCAHTLGLGYIILSMLFGYKVGHCRTLTLFDNSPGLMSGNKGDFTELKPTSSFVVPLIVDRLVKAVIAKIKIKPRFIQLLFDFALHYKIHFLKMGHLSSPIIDNVLFRKIRDAIGGRLRLVYSAGGPISKNTSFVFSALFNINLKQVYGTTESFGAGTLSDYNRPYSVDCGAVSPSIEIKLIPWTEGNYKPNDIPNPRGEVCLSGASIAQGYYQLEEETKRKFQFDQNNHKRWYLTGDIAEFFPSGNFTIIDRKENIIKLTGGEFVSLAKVEKYISNSDYVELCCCVPSTNHSSLVAIISPKRLKISEFLASQRNIHHAGDLTPYIDDPQIQQMIIDDVKSKTKSLTKWERPSKFIITHDDWTPENKLLTSIYKIRRPNIKKHYHHLI